MISAERIISKELQPKISGEIVFDNATLEEYSTLHCIYKIRPLAVVYPKSVEDIQHTVRFCAANEIALIPRGGGTGLVGQAVGLGIIVDLSKYMNAILGIENTLLHVQAGCKIQTINEYLKPFGRIHSIDPQSAKWCTIGGNISTNASGAHGIKYGATKDVIKEMTIVLANGDVVTINDSGVLQGSETAKNIFNSAAQSLLKNEMLILSNIPNTLKNSSGYNIFDAVNNHSFHPIKLFCGSEGTLGIIAETKIETISIPSYSEAVIVYCRSYENAVQATQRALTFQPAAIEILDKSYSDYGKGISKEIDSFIAQDFQAMLLIEFEGDSQIDLKDKISLLLKNISDAGLINAHKFLCSEEERLSAWRLREDVAMKLNQLQTERKKASIVEDGVVPIENLPQYITGIKKIFEKHNIPYTLYGHAGVGNIHCSTFVDFQSEEGKRDIQIAATEVFELVISLHGLLSGEHGDGLVRTPFLKRAFGKEIYALFEEVKKIFDPKNIFNPNKIVGKQDGNFFHDIKYN